MNTFFWLLVILGLILCWFLLSFAFEGVGTVAYKIYKDAKDELCKENENENERTKENEENEG